MSISLLSVFPVNLLFRLCKGFLMHGHISYEFVCESFYFYIVFGFCISPLMVIFQFHICNIWVKMHTDWKPHVI